MCGNYEILVSGVIVAVNLLKLPVLQKFSLPMVVGFFKDSIVNKPQHFPISLGEQLHETGEIVDSNKGKSWELKNEIKTKPKNRRKNN